MIKRLQFFCKNCPFGLLLDTKADIIKQSHIIIRCLWEGGDLFVSESCGCTFSKKGCQWDSLLGESDVC